MTRDIRYEEINNGRWRHQVTVTEYPGRLAAFFGAKPIVRVFVMQHLVWESENVGWYELPDFAELSCIGSLAYEIKHSLMADQFVAAR